MTGDFLRDAYYNLEEKYYAVLDRIDKIIPVYKIIDPIDRILPSFAVLLCIIIILLIIGCWYLLGLVLVKPTVGITLQVQTNKGDLIPNAFVKFTSLEPPMQFVTNSEGLTPKQEFEKGSKVKFEVSKKGFETKKGEFTADSSKLIEVVLTEKAIASLNKTIIIKDSLGRLILKPAHFSFACTGPGIPEPKETTTSNGSVRVLMPSSCKTLIASVEVAGFQSKQSINITEKTQEIQLQELETELSTIKARVLFNNEPVPGIIVGLYEFELGPLEEKTTDSTGLAEFKTPASSYQLKTKPTSEYGQKTSEEFTTTPGQVVEKKIELKKDISALLSVNVLEKNTNKKISGALVSIKKENNIIDRKTTDSNGSVSFNLNALGSYSISADHSDYLIEEKTINIASIGNFNETIILEKFTGDNAATLKVKVLDSETQKPVKNARVALYYGQSEEKQGFLAPYTEQLTDINGIARFPRVKPGTYYYAVAAKQGAFGKSDSQRFDLRNADSFYLNVSLIIPHGTVKVIIKDNDGMPVSNAKVSLFDAFDDSLIGSDLTDNNGVWVLSSESNFAKADKEVFVRVEKNALMPNEKDFMPYTTVSKPILPNAVQTFDITMQEKILGGNFKLKPLGLFKKDKQVSNIVSSTASPNLSAGQQYIAKFLIEVPVGQTYTQNILHLHGGKGDFGYGIMEKDSIVLKTVNMPLSNNVLKATSLDKSNGFDNDAGTATAGDAKWANIAIPKLSEGIFEAEAIFEVKNNAIVGEQVGIYSWLSGMLEGEEKFYPPMETQPKDDFYVEPPQKQLFQIGIETLCDSEFCFNASIKEAIPGGFGESVENSYNAKILNNYKLVFNISNNSKTTVHNDAQLRIKNEDEAINFKEYSITLPSGRTVSGTNSKSELPNIDIKNSQNQNKFEKGSVIFGELLFTPQKTTNSTISFKIASSSNTQHTGLYTIVFQKDLTIVVSASNEFEVQVSPEELAAGIENSVEVLVKDSKTGLEVENATVTAKDRFGNALATSLTSRLGIAKLKIPELLPKEEITLEISKPDYNLKKVKLKANAVLLSAKPETISISINSTIEKEKTTELVLENISTITLKISGMEYSTTSLNLLDDTAINNALIEQTGFELAPGAKKTIKFTAFLTQEGMNLKQRQQTEGTLIVKTENSGNTWSLEIPVKTIIGFGAELDSQDCLQVMPKFWQTSTQGKSVSYSFKIQNNCSSNTKPISLSNLEAKVLWNGNEVGSFLLALHASKTSGAISAAELRAGYFKTMLERFEPEKSIDALLTFTPFGGINGTANAKIIIQARNKAENSKEDQILTQEITTQISIVNLQECIIFSNDTLSIAKDSKLPESTASFSIANKKDCGNVKVLLSTMPSNSLNLSKTELIIPDGTISEPIIVSAGKNTHPGIYAILVKAQLQGQATPSAITSTIEKDKTIKVKVFDTGLCFQLDKYEFNVWDDALIAEDGFDTAELTNYCYEKKVPFQVDMKDLIDSVARNAATQGSRGPCPLTSLLPALGELLKNLMGGRGSAGQQAMQQAAVQAAGAQAALQGIKQSITDTTAAQNAVENEITESCNAFNSTQALYYESNPEQGIGCNAITVAEKLQEKNQNSIEKILLEEETNANPESSYSSESSGNAIIEEQFIKAKNWVEQKILKDVQKYCLEVECIGLNNTEACYENCTERKIKEEQHHLSELETNFNLIKQNCLSDSQSKKTSQDSSSDSETPKTTTLEIHNDTINIHAMTMPKEKTKNAVFFIEAEPSNKSYFNQAIERTEKAENCFKALEQTVGKVNSNKGLLGVTSLPKTIPPTNQEVKEILDPIAKAELEQLKTKLESLERKITEADAKVKSIIPAADSAIQAKTIALKTQNSALTPISQFARPALALMQTAISNTENALKPEKQIAEKANALSKTLTESKTNTNKETRKTNTTYKTQAENLEYDKIAQELVNDTKKTLEKEKQKTAESTHKNLDTGKGSSPAKTSGTILAIANTAKEMLNSTLQALNNALSKLGISKEKNQEQQNNTIMPTETLSTENEEPSLRTNPQTSTESTEESPSESSCTSGACQLNNNFYTSSALVSSFGNFTGFAILDSAGFGANSLGYGDYYGSPYGSPYYGIPNYGSAFDPIGGLTNPYSSMYNAGIFGSNPLTQGLGGFLGNTLYDLSNNELTGFTAVKPDIEILGFEILTPNLQLDDEISVSVIGNPITDNRIDSTLMNESIGLSFTNNYPDNRGVFFKVLKVIAIRHYYEENTIVKPSAVKKGKVNIKERKDSPKDASQYFLLQFNEIDPKTIGATSTVPPENLDCVSFAPPGLHGNTGIEAAPKVLLDWSWNSIKSNTCDADNPNFVFCDGVQFSMEVLRKIQLIREFLASNKLTCPSATEAIGAKENIIESDDVGISKLYTDVIARTGVSDINVVVSVENKAPVSLAVKLSVVVTNPATGVSLPACEKQLNVASKTIVGCEFSGLMQDNTAYTVTASIQPNLSNCPVSNCNSKATNDIVSSAFVVTEKPLLQECEPYNTSRLKDFIAATEKQGEVLVYPQGLSKEEFLKTLHFNAFLIQDRYSPDLQADFDDYYRNIAFAQTPAWYKGSGTDPGLGVIFKDFKAFRIAPKFGEAPEIGYLLPSPGLYEGTIEIEFGNNEWQFFMNGQSDVKVLVKLQKSPTQPEALSPFYYMPFDGLVGTVDSQGGRTRYGLNYKGEILNITSGSDIVRSIGGASWSAFSESGILETSFESNFKKLNVENRGQILRAERNKLVFSPSYATPVILKVQNNNGEACASYNFGVNGVDTYLGMESNPWWGVGENCKDFDGSLMIEKWQNGIMDKSNATTGSWQTQCGNAQTTVYGLEWSGTQKNFGKVFLKTIFYTPQKMQNSINIVMQDDDAELITPSSSGKTNIPLTGIGASAENLQAVSEVIELVKQRQVCVSGESTEQVFWWNPRQVMNALADAEISASQECIK